MGGTIDGYQVKREINVKEIGDEIYIVTFTETWSKAGESSWSVSYKVDRDSLSATGGKGKIPPYYQKAVK